jgi:hypothetical protein
MRKFIILLVVMAGCKAPQTSARLSIEQTGWKSEPTLKIEVRAY